MNHPVQLGLSILELSKTVMYEFWYDNVKPKYGEKAKLCYMYTDSFIEYIKRDNIYIDTTEDVKTRFGTSNYELTIPLLKGKKQESYWCNENNLLDYKQKISFNIIIYT